MNRLRLPLTGDPLPHIDPAIQPDVAAQSRQDFDRLFGDIDQRIANERIVRRAEQCGLVRVLAHSDQRV